MPTPRSARIHGLLFGAAFVGGCLRPSADHCANRGVDAACLELYPDGSRPYCWSCTAERNGCAPDKPSEPQCIPEATASSSGVTVSSAESSAGTPTTAGTSSSSATATTQGGSGPSDSSSGGPTCGNDQIEADEKCDGTDVGGLDCADFQLGTGALGCSSDCTAFDTEMCSIQVMCGDGEIGGTEDCDGDEIGDAMCSDIGTFVGGELDCNGECGFDTTNCEQCHAVDDPCEVDEDCCAGLTCGLLNITMVCAII